MTPYAKQNNTFHFKKIIVYLVLHLAVLGILLSVFFFTPKEDQSYPVLRFVIICFASVLLTKYFLYMAISPWHNVLNAYREYKHGHKNHLTTSSYYYPRVSVLIPAWNEENGVVTTVKALLASTYKNMEIVVINNASTDNTEHNALKLVSEHNRLRSGDEPHINLIYACENNQGKGHALNSGIRLAKGDIIVSIDADCYVPPKTIENFVAYFKDPKVMAAVGNVKIGNTKTLLGVVQYLEFLFSFYFKKGDSLMNSIYIIGGAAGAFRKEVFEKIGYYDTNNITEDIELSVRIQDAGMKIVYASDALVYTEGASDLQGLMKQRLRWKRGRFETFIKHRHLFFSTDKRHNKILSWVILPLALFGELQLSLEMLFLAFLYVFSYLTNDYSSFLSGIIVVSSMFFIQVLFDEHSESRTRFLLLAPIGWLLFYVSTFVESNALVRALWGYATGKKITWQQWNRTGVFSKQS